MKLSNCQYLHKPLSRFPRLIRVGSILFICLLPLTCAWIALRAFGNIPVTAGPMTGRMETRLGISGDPARIELPLMDGLHASSQTHHGPFKVRVSEIRVRSDEAATQVFGRGEGAQAAYRQVQSEAPQVLPHAILSALAVALLGALCLPLVIYRQQPQRIALSSGVTVLALVASALWSWMTYDTNAPFTFQGPNSNKVAEAARSFDSLSEELDQRKPELLAVIGATFNPDGSFKIAAPAKSPYIRVLHVSDIHLSLEGTAFMRAWADHYQVDFILDTGDLASLGTPFDPLIANLIGDIPYPYLFVPGNHDDDAVVQAMARQSNVKVLDGRPSGRSPRVVEQSGLLVYGRSHPVCSECVIIDPTSTEITAGAEAIAGDMVTEVLAMQRKPDIVAVHQDAMTGELAGKVPLVLSGHMPSRQWIKEGTQFLRVGSTGAEGFKACADTKVKRYMHAHLLEFDPATRQLMRYKVVRALPSCWEDGDASITTHYLDRSPTVLAQPGS